jgi:uncharacterized cupredoxin-like copper-binding protein
VSQLPDDGVAAAAPVVPSSGSRRVQAGRLLAILAALFLVPIVVVVGVSAASSAQPPYAMTIRIDIHYSHYDPSALSAPVGVPIRFVIVNADPIDHEWIVGDAAIHAIHRTGTEMHHGARPTEVSIAAGQTVETVVTFTKPERLTYVCHLPGHEQYGMVGTLDIR